MPLPSSRVASRPVYREVIGQALKTAWYGWRYWPLALFASFLLTAGTYDSLPRSLDMISQQSQMLTNSASMQQAQGLLSAVLQGNSTLSLLIGLQVVATFGLLMLAMLIFSCVSQAGLIYSIGVMKRGERPPVGEAIRVGGSVFWPVASVNFISIVVQWILRFFIAIPLWFAVTTPSSGLSFLFLAAFLLFTWISFIVTIIEIFALNAIVLQGSSVKDAIVRGYLLFKKHWVVAIETAAILFVLAMVLGAVAVALAFVALIPVFAAMIAAALAHSTGLYYGIVGGGVGLLICGILALASFLTQLQYATWTHLYRRLGEGDVLPKLHRWYQSVTGSESR